MTRTIDLTYPIAMAAATDAGNRSMRLAGRDHWSREDWQAACDALQPLLAALESADKERFHP